MEYEFLFFTNLANEENVSDIKKEIEEAIGKSGGKIISWSDIGKRKFAHPIKRHTHGFFSFARFTLEEKFGIPDIERRIKLNNRIMRHIIVRASEIGKPVTISDREAKEMRSRPEPKRSLPTAPVAPEAKKEEPEVAPPVETKEKASLDDLDKKIDEILDETPV